MEQSSIQNFWQQAQSFLTSDSCLFFPLSSPFLPLCLSTFFLHLFFLRRWSVTPNDRNFKRRCKSDLIRPKARQELNSMIKMEQELALSQWITPLQEFQSTFQMYLYNKSCRSIRGCYVCSCHEWFSTLPAFFPPLFKFPGPKREHQTGQACPLAIKRSWFLQPLKREEASASHQDYAWRRKPKGMLVPVRRAVEKKVTNVLYNLSQWMPPESGDIGHGGRDLVPKLWLGMMLIREEVQMLCGHDTHLSPGCFMKGCTEHQAGWWQSTAISAARKQRWWEADLTHTLTKEQKGALLMWASLPSSNA